MAAIDPSVLITCSPFAPPVGWGAQMVMDKPYTP